MEGLAAKLGARVAVVAFVAAIGWLNVAAWGTWSEQRRLEQEGVWAVADVLDTRSADVPRSDGQWVTVGFGAAGHQVTVDVEVDDATLERATGSGRLDVVYASDDPMVVWVVGDGRPGMMAVVAGVVDLTLVGGVAALIVNDRKRMRSERE